MLVISKTNPNDENIDFYTYESIIKIGSFFFLFYFHNYFLSISWGRLNHKIHEIQIASKKSWADMYGDDRKIKKLKYGLFYSTY